MYNVFNNNERFLAITTDRNGGFSQGSYASLNLGYHVGDDFKTVQKNYDVLCEKLLLKRENIYLPAQTHSANLVEITKDSSKSIPDCDALYTKDKTIAIGVLTADCLPILLYCPDKELVAAIHAGWLGSTKLITHKVVRYLIEYEEVDPALMLVYLGPSIFQNVYEVGQNVYDLACANEFGEECFIALENNKFQFDNRRFNVMQLLDCQVDKKNINYLNECTYTNPNYFSYRRDKQCGRQLSLISLK